MTIHPPEYLLDHLCSMEGGQERIRPILDELLLALREKFDTLEAKWRNRNRKRLLVLGIDVLTDIAPRWKELSLNQQCVIRDLLSYLILVNVVPRDSVLAWLKFLKNTHLPIVNVFAKHDPQDQSCT